MLGILEKIHVGPAQLVFNGYISNHNKMWRPRPKFKVSLYLYFCCFWINVTHINFKNIKRNIQRIISDSCFQLKSWFNIEVYRAPSIPLLNFPFNESMIRNWNIIYFQFHAHSPILIVEFLDGFFRKSPWNLLTNWCNSVTIKLMKKFSLWTKSSFIFVFFFC